MARLVWQELVHTRDVDKVVVYPRSGPAEVWDDLVSIDEVFVSIQDLVRYRDGRAYENRRADNGFSASASCFTCPKTILKPRTVFDMTYRVKGEKLHLVYNTTATLGGRAFYQDDAEPFVLGLSAAPIPMPSGLKPSAHLIVDSTFVSTSIVSVLESILYGEETTEPRLPSPDEIFDLFKAA